MFSVCNQADGSEKDTIRNLRRLPECVVHICNSAIATRMNICATDFPADVSEIEMAGFTAVRSHYVRPPRIGEAPVQMECRVTRILDFGTRQHNHVVFAEVVLFHFHDDIVNGRYYVDASKLDPIGRVSGNLYTRMSATFSMERQFLGAKPEMLT
jgi:flavin reductase (DIM6/NTAB) family NADH-FMN oxidoreductase RutF